ncbi:OmpH family outer membrane protein [Winogradskyella immobilis]|uniref:OmpH family outer membrane protein n=1 Tax=Winogradskyella immobilis TaxID=2816852 RepID=A0ABS8EKP2_9FLAO|nr:OmpH family outer membrane protein [Winogradskyella immobilis]MCC1483779.1 OmpH family outer membrane protein [Winogradskyella immobilis]MCG0015873.1 OmpH family outer membrane protein [Winogradskyella immobilis]
MKHLKTLLLATTLFFGATSLSNAQGKVAHINLQEVIVAMPEYDAAKAEVDKAGKTYQAEVDEFIKELQTKAKQYQDESAAQTNEENAKRSQEIEGMQQSIGQYQQQAQQKLQKLEFDLIKPIREKAQAAVEKISKAQGYEYVLELSTLVVANGKDITADVKKELGLQ